MDFLKIDSHVALPAQKSKYPFAKMEVGDSVFFDGETTQSKQVIFAYNYARKSGKKFSARAEGEGVRVWRTA